MPTIHLLRHAQSEANGYAGILQKHDVGITELGKRQAAKVSGDFDLVVISPMRRCHETLENTQITYKDIVVDEDARESKWYPSDFKEGEEEIDEPEEELIERVARLRKRLIELANDEKRVLLVAHYHTILYLTAIGNGRYKGNGLILGNAQLTKYNF